MAKAAGNRQNEKSAKARAKPEMAVSAGARPQMRKRGSPHWTEAKKETYLATLETMCNIAASLRAVDMSHTALRRLRAREGAFRARERATIATAHTNLQWFALERMMTGTVRTTTGPDGAVTTVHEYPLHLAIQLLRIHKETAAEVAAETELDDGEVDAVVRKLLRRLVRVEERDAAIAAKAGATPPPEAAKSRDGAESPDGADGADSGDGAAAPGGGSESDDGRTEGTPPPDRAC